MAELKARLTASTVQIDDNDILEPPPPPEVVIDDAPLISTPDPQFEPPLHKVWLYVSLVLGIFLVILLIVLLVWFFHLKNSQSTNTSTQVFYSNTSTDDIYMTTSNAPAYLDFGYFSDPKNKIKSKILRKQRSVRDTFRQVIVEEEEV